MSLHSPYKMMGQIFLAAAWVFFFSAATFAEEFPRLDRVRGEVKIFGQQETGGRKAEKGMPLLPLQVVRTIGKGSYSDIRFDNGTLIRIMPGSRVTLFKADRGEDKFVVEIGVTSGKVFNAVLVAAKKYRYLIKTPAGTIRAKRGTVFSVAVGESGSLVMVREGALKIRNPAVSSAWVLVPSYRKTRMEENQAPSQPVPLTLAEFDAFGPVAKLMERQRRQLKTREGDELQQLFDDLFDD